jgi:hypothetical protein
MDASTFLRGGHGCAGREGGACQTDLLVEVPTNFARKLEALSPGVNGHGVGSGWVEALVGNSCLVNALSLFARLDDGRVLAWATTGRVSWGLGDTTARATRDAALHLASHSAVTLAAMSDASVLSAAARMTLLTEQ